MIVNNSVKRQPRKVILAVFLSFLVERK